MPFIPQGERSRFPDSFMPLGTQPEFGTVLCVAEKDRFAGTYILGVQGTGKSSFIETLIAHDAQVGNGIIVIDPHGDLTTHCLSQLPVHRLPHTYMLDMEDEAYPFGVNVFADVDRSTAVAQAQAIDRIMHIFEVLWDEVLSQQYLPRYLRAAIITMLDNPGSTLVDLYQFLIDSDKRQRMLQQVRDHDIRRFWQTQYDGLSEVEQARRVQPLVNRLEALFLGRSLVKNIVGQRQTSINFRKVIEHREVLFIRLPTKTVPQDARLIGTILMSQIYSAIFSFANVPEAARPGVSLYVDEFQHFSTPDFSALFTEGRKFGAKVTVAHQYRGQLPSFLKQSTMTARTKVCFQVIPDDAHEMAHLFPSETEQVLPEDIDPHPVQRLLHYGSDNPYAKVLIEEYLRPMLTYKRGNKVDIQDKQWNVNWTKTILYGAKAGITREDFYVPDPTPYLDHLLYQVMRQGDPRLPIPIEAALGFSNGGRGFFTVARNAKDSPDLTNSVQFPPHLVQMTPNGPQWIKMPKNANEQFLHFVFMLRMTMAHLAENPIGKKTRASSGDVAQMLTQLPPRIALARAATDVGMIHTMDTAPGATGMDQWQRVKNVLTHTRAKYCYPRDNIETAFRPPAAAPASASASPMPGAMVADEVTPDDELDPTIVVKRPNRWDDDTQ